VFVLMLEYPFPTLQYTVGMSLRDAVGLSNAGLGRMHREKPNFLFEALRPNLI